MGRLEGKVAIITGGNSGVGAATAVKFAAEGAKVVITARREAPLQEVADKIRAAGGEVLPVASDISKVEDAKKVVEETLKAFGKRGEIDALRVCSPYRRRSVVLEVYGDVLDALHFRHGFRSIRGLDVGYDEPLLVGLVTVAFHADPAEFRTVRAPYRIGVVSASHLDDLCLCRAYIIYVYFRIC